MIHLGCAIRGVVRGADCGSAFPVPGGNLAGQFEFYNSEKCSFSEHEWSNCEPEKSHVTSLTSDNFTPNLGPCRRHVLARSCRGSPGPRPASMGPPYPPPTWVMYSFSIPMLAWYSMHEPRNYSVPPTCDIRSEASYKSTNSRLAHHG